MIGIAVGKPQFPYAVRPEQIWLTNSYNLLCIQTVYKLAFDATKTVVYYYMH